MKNIVIALFLGTIQSVKIDTEKHHHHTHSLSMLPEDYAQVNSEAFADAAVQARIDADSDISNEVRHHHMVNAESHNKAWKKHFKDSDFYQSYAQHTETQEKCEGDCLNRKRQLAQIKSNYKELQSKFEDLKKQATKENLVQLDLERPKEAQNVNILEESPFGLAGGQYGPAYPSPQPFVRGEKQWMENAQNIGDWGKQQEVVANSRIPYASTLVQINDDVLHEDIMDDDANLDILYEKETPMNKRQEIEKLSQTTAVPLDFHFVQTAAQDNNPKNMEGFCAERVPLDADFVHLKTETTHH